VDIGVVFLFDSSVAREAKKLGFGGRSEAVVTDLE
jgi:hypothetical protein